MRKADREAEAVGWGQWHQRPGLRSPTSWWGEDLTCLHAGRTAPTGPPDPQLGWNCHFPRSGKQELPSWDGGLSCQLDIQEGTLGPGPTARPGTAMFRKRPGMGTWIWNHQGWRSFSRDGRDEQGWSVQRREGQAGRQEVPEARSRGLVGRGWKQESEREGLQLHPASPTGPVMGLGTTPWLGTAEVMLPPQERCQ